MDLNVHEQQRGIPAPGGNNHQGQNRRPPRARDVRRMGEFNRRQQMNEVEASGDHAHAFFDDPVRGPPSVAKAPGTPGAPPRPSGGRKSGRGPPPAKTPTEETPPRDEPLYLGNGRGSKPVKKTLAQNFEMSGFIPLVRQVYDRMAVVDSHLPRKLPYPIFQHAMTEFLVAYQLHKAKYELKAPSLQNQMDPLDAISASGYNIPVPIYDYICGIGAAMTPTGDKVFWNLPVVAIPRYATTHVNTTLRAGSFGPITATNHNVYECYISPYVTSEYVLRSAALTPQSRLTWNPLPRGWYPPNGIVNENLLGYRDMQRLHADSMRKLGLCEFDQTDTMTGLLCHSAYAMNLSSGVLGATPDIRITKAEFKEKSNSAAFIYKERISEEDPLAILWDEPSTLKSPFSFSMAASNRANYSAYKRKRDSGIPGTCYTVAGIPPADWLPTINSNYNVEGPFSLQRGFHDRESLRADDHEEEEGLGTVTQEVFQWLETSLLSRK